VIQVVIGKSVSFIAQGSEICEPGRLFHGRLSGAVVGSKIFSEQAGDKLMTLRGQMTFMGKVPRLAAVVRGGEH